MDETPEELERIRIEAAAIDPNKYKKRGRLFAAVGLGALGAGVVWVVLEATDQSRNPCERVRDFLCERAPNSAECQSYQGIVEESEDDESPKMRSLIRQQCVTKLERLAAEQGTKVP